MCFIRAVHLHLEQSRWSTDWIAQLREVKTPSLRLPLRREPSSHTQLRIFALCFVFLLWYELSGGEVGLGRGGSEKKICTSEGNEGAGSLLGMAG